MNESDLHRELVKLYLLYFESCNYFEDTKSRTSYLKTVRLLKKIEKTAYKRRQEVKEKYKATDGYKKLTSPDGVLTKKVEIMRSKYGPFDNNKK